MKKFVTLAVLIVEGARGEVTKPKADSETRGRRNTVLRGGLGMKTGSGVLTALMLVAFVLVPLAAEGQGPGPGLMDRVTALEALVATLRSQVATLQAQQAPLQFMMVEDGPINGLAGPHLIITEVNVHIRSGSNATDDGGTPTGLGNLVIGYNEESVLAEVPTERSGAHNLVVGPGHQYTSTGGFVAGFENKITGTSASVSGGDSTRRAVCGPASAGVVATLIARPTRRAAPTPASAGGTPTRPEAGAPASAGGGTPGRTANSTGERALCSQTSLTEIDNGNPQGAGALSAFPG
jgi:hypothetical protein